VPRARSPFLFFAVALLYGALDWRRLPLSPVLRSLVTVRVSQFNWCRFCVDLDSMTLARRAGSMEKAEKSAGWRESVVFAESERVALECTEATTMTDRGASDELMAGLRRHFDDAVVELTRQIALQNLSSKFNAALDVPSQGFCRMPAATSGSPAAGGETEAHH
jgi:AhpD family alkylhydroperoxidase